MSHIGHVVYNTFQPVPITPNPYQMRDCKNCGMGFVIWHEHASHENVCMVVPNISANFFMERGAIYPKFTVPVNDDIRIPSPTEINSMTSPFLQLKGLAKPTEVARVAMAKPTEVAQTASPTVLPPMPKLIPVVMAKPAVAMAKPAVAMAKPAVAMPKPTLAKPKTLAKPMKHVAPTCNWQELLKVASDEWALLI